MDASLNQYIGFRYVLEKINCPITVFSLPAMITCPACLRKNKRSYHKNMKVMRLPNGGLWWYCYKHQRGWDSIELLAYYDKLSIEAELNKLIADPDSGIPQEAAYSDFKEAYLKEHKTRLNFQTWTDLTRKSWLSNKDIVNCFNDKIKLKFDLLISRDFLESTLGLWLRFTTKNQLEELINNGIKSNLSNRNFKNALAMPWFTIPGKLSSIFLVGSKYCKLWKPNTLDSVDVGAMFIETLPPETERIVAVSSPYLGLYLQCYNFYETSTTAPIVVWHEDTDPKIWGQLGVKEIIFWSYEPTPGLFKQALNAPVTSYVSWIDDPVFKVTYDYKTIESLETWRYMQGHLRSFHFSVKQLLRDISNHIRKPEVACKDWLLEQNPAEVKFILSILNLTEEQRDALLATCKTQKQSDNLNHILNTSLNLKEVEMFGGIVQQYIGNSRAHWSLIKNGKEEILSEAVVLLDKCFVDEEQEDTTYLGNIFYQGQKYPFKTSYKRLKKDPIRAIQFAIERAGGGTPFVSRLHCNKIWDLIFRFSKINETSKLVSKVGWTKEKEYLIFPEFIIEHGELKPKRSFKLGSIPPPLYGLGFPELDGNELLKSLDSNESNAIRIAILTAIFFNILQKGQEKEFFNICLCGQAAQKIGQQIADDLKLIKPQGNTLDLKTVLEESKLHDVPSYIQPVFTKRILPELIYTYIFEGNNNLILNLQDFQIYSLLLHKKKCICITDTNLVDDLSTDSYSLFSFGLAYLQSISERIPRNRPLTLEFLLDKLHEWVQQVTGRKFSYIFKYASSCFSQFKTEKIFINLIASLIQNNLGTQNEQFHPTNLVTLDYVNKKIKISITRLNEILQTLNLPLPNYEKIFNSLKKYGSVVDDSSNYVSLNIKVWNVFLDKSKTG